MNTTDLHYVGDRKHRSWI